MYFLGYPAFKKGKEYSWKWNTEKDADESGCEYIYQSEITDKHYLSTADVIEFFLDN